MANVRLKDCRAEKVTADLNGFVVSYFNERVSTFEKWWATYVQVQ